MAVKENQDSGNEVDPGPEWHIFHILTSEGIDDIIRVVIGKEILQSCKSTCTNC